MKVGVGTVEKLTLENIDIALGILSLGDREREIHLGDTFSKYYCNTRVKVDIIAHFS